jgi:hypothetical protein
MKKLLIFALGLSIFGVSCTDSAKDPLQFDKITNGSILALRGVAFDNLFDLTYRGASDRFSRVADPAAESFEFEGEYLSTDPNNLSEVQLFARSEDGGARTRVTVIPASQFSSPTDGTNRKVSVNVPLTTILTALSKSATDFAANKYIYLEIDLLLNDGTTVSAADIVNSSLYESAIFYPAHQMLYLVTE